MTPHHRLKPGAAVTPPVTAWFRVPAVWQLLREHFRSIAHRHVVVWSGGCCSGQEPYSAAFTLMAAGVPSWEVVGTDINADLLRVARRGRYPVADVHYEIPAAAAAQFFNKQGSEYVVPPAVRRRVRFERASLAVDAPPRCDVALVRNCWRHIDRRAQAVLAARLAEMLPNDGFVVVGGADLWTPPLASAAVRDGLRPPGDCVPNALSSNFRVGSHPMIWQKKTPEPAVNL